jgi:DNA-binding response OmpR family regulator
MELAHAVLAHRNGHAREASHHLQRAATEAASCQADEGLIAKLYESVSMLGSEKAPSDADAPNEGALVIDGELNEIHVGRHRVSLSSRSVLRPLIYAFACAPDHHLTRDVIARALWGTAYDPLRHESSLKSNIRRLRSLLIGTGAVLQSDGDGYRLHLPRGAVVIPPPQAAPPSG